MEKVSFLSIPSSLLSTFPVLCREGYFSRALGGVGDFTVGEIVERRTDGSDPWQGLNGVSLLAKATCDGRDRRIGKLFSYCRSFFLPIPRQARRQSTERVQWKNGKGNCTVERRASKSKFFFCGAYVRPIEETLYF